MAGPCSASRLARVKPAVRRPAHGERCVTLLVHMRRNSLTGGTASVELLHLRLRLLQPETARATSWCRLGLTARYGLGCHPRVRAPPVRRPWVPRVEHLSVREGIPTAGLVRGLTGSAWPNRARDYRCSKAEPLQGIGRRARSPQVAARQRQWDTRQRRPGRGRAARRSHHRPGRQDKKNGTGASTRGRARRRGRHALAGAALSPSGSSSRSGSTGARRGRGCGRRSRPASA